MSHDAKQSEHLLVRSEHLDTLLSLAGRVIVASSSQGLAHRTLAARYSARELVDSESVDAAKDLATTSSQLAAELHHLVQSIRMVSLKDFSFRARRLVRDTARRTGKLVHFDVEGEETTVDKAVLEKLADPIAHQLRNALDHGIEDALTRTRNGKDEEGHVILRAYNTERETVIEIEDDGAGVDLEKLRKRAIEIGLIDEATPFNEDLAIQLMAMPGFSTAQSVSEVSGRGVGMDVVSSNIIELGGRLTFETELGRGSTFLFRVPLVSAVNILDGLIVRARDHMLAFPVESIVANIAVRKADINSVFEKGPTIRHLGQLLPLFDLGEILDGEPIEVEGDQIPVLIVEDRGRQLAFRVTEFDAPQKLVVIPFDEEMETPGLEGSTILGNKRLGFIVDVPELLDLALGNEGVKKTTASVKKVSAEDDGVSSASPTKDAPEKAHPITDREQHVQSDDEDDEATRQEFVAEIEKMVPQLNQAVFDLEKSPDDQDLVNTAFRLFHTIKGNLIMIGFPKGGETVHRVESVLDRARAGELELDVKVIDVLMDGVSYVEELMQRCRRGLWQDQAGETILELTDGLLPKPEKTRSEQLDVVDSPVELSAEATHRATNYRKRRVPFYQCYVEFEADLQPPVLVACLIYKRVSEQGDVLGTVPPLPEVEQGTMDGRFKLLMASEAEPEKLEARLGWLLKTHYGARVFRFTRFE